jgi:hypothetical protein
VAEAVTWSVSVQQKQGNTNMGWILMHTYLFSLVFLELAPVKSSSQLWGVRTRSMNFYFRNGMPDVVEILNDCQHWSTVDHLSQWSIIEFSFVLMVLCVGLSPLIFMRMTFCLFNIWFVSEVGLYLFYFFCFIFNIYI